MLITIYTRDKFRLAYIDMTIKAINSKYQIAFNYQEVFCSLVQYEQTNVWYTTYFITEPLVLSWNDDQAYISNDGIINS